MDVKKRLLISRKAHLILPTHKLLDATSEAAKGKDQALDEIATNVAESFFLIDDAHAALVSYLASLEADPTRLDYLQERKAALSTFVKKWGGAGNVDEEMAEIAIRVKSAKEMIADLHGGQDRIAELESEIKSIKGKGCIKKRAEALNLLFC